MFKKSVEIGQYDDIQFANGKVKFQGVALNVFVYTIDGILIDTGSASLLKQFTPFFEQANIDQVYITHDHEDHTGGASYFVDKGVPVFINQASIEAVSKRATYPLYRKLFWGKRSAFEASALPAEFESRTNRWKSIATPGHTEDHLSFLNVDRGIVFTGDLFVSSKVKIILRNESIPTTLRSIEHLLSYDFETIICQHAGVIENGRQALKDKQEHLLQLINDVLTMNNKGMNVKEIQHEIFPKTYPIKRFSLGEWDSLHVVTSILDDPFVKG